MNRQIPMTTLVSARTEHLAALEADWLKKALGDSSFDYAGRIVRAAQLVTQSAVQPTDSPAQWVVLTEPTIARVHVSFGTTQCTCDDWQDHRHDRHYLCEHGIATRLELSLRDEAGSAPCATQRNGSRVWWG